MRHLRNLVVLCAAFGILLHAALTARHSVRMSGTANISAVSELLAALQIMCNGDVATNHAPPGDPSQDVCCPVCAGFGQIDLLDAPDAAAMGRLLAGLDSSVNATAQLARPAYALRPPTRGPPSHG